MFNLLKKVGITLVRVTNVISSKAFNVGYNSAIHIVGMAIHLVRVARNEGPSYFVKNLVGTPFILLNIALKKNGDKPVFGDVDVWQKDENDDLLAKHLGDTSTLKERAHPSSNPFFVAWDSANKSIHRKNAFLKNTQRIITRFTFVGVGIYIGSFVLPYYLCLFLDGLNGLKFIQDISKNILLVIDGVDDTKFMQLFLKGDRKGLRQSFEAEEFSTKDLERFSEIVDYYKYNMDESGVKFAEDVPYNSKELQYFQQLHHFTVSEERRAKIDRTVRKSLQNNTPLPNVCNSLILSYANNFGINTDDKPNAPKNMFSDIDPEIIKLRNNELGLNSW